MVEGYLGPLQILKKPWDDSSQGEIVKEGFRSLENPV